jgi:hypothetical protein
MILTDRFLLGTEQEVPVPVSAELAEFARRLMENVRDEAIRECDMLARLGGRAAVTGRWRKAAKTRDPEALLKEAIPDIVDDTLFWLLYAIDEGWLKLSYTAENGKVIELHGIDPGDLAGWLGGGEGGWTTTYSKQRFIDDSPHAGDPYQP